LSGKTKHFARRQNDSLRNKKRKIYDWVSERRKCQPNNKFFGEVRQKDGYCRGGDLQTGNEPSNEKIKE